MRSVRSLALLLSVALVSSACATMGGGSTEPIVIPPQGKTPQAVAEDKATCDALARKATGYKEGSGDAVKEGVKWGAIGAIGGAAVGAIAGFFGGDAGTGATLGALIGAPALGGQAASNALNGPKGRYERTYMICLAQRGYAVTQ